MITGQKILLGILFVLFGWFLQGEHPSEAPESGNRSSVTNETPTPYSLPNTEVRMLRSLETDVNYVLYISLPAQYNRTTREYPVLFLLDADYSFAIAHNVLEHFIQRNNLAGIILVGIAYRGKSQDMEIYRKNRVRDYTLSHVDSGVYTEEISAYSGGGKAFLRFINHGLTPYLAVHYRVADDRGIVGHSLGGYFATYTLIHSPATFNRYIIVSPSLWYDDHMIFRTDYSELTSFTRTDIKVFFGVGAYENQPGRGWPMVDDMLRMADELRGLDLDNLDVQAEVFPDEIHNSIFPAAFTRGVRIVYD